MLTRKRIIIIAIAAVGAIVAYFIFSALNSYKKSDSFATNIQYADMKNGKVSFFTGSNFAQLNIISGKTESISPILILPPITSMELGNNGAIFQATDYSPVDDLYKILISKNIPTNDSYWWYYNLESKKYELLIDEENNRPASAAKWVNDNEFVYMALPGEADAKKLNTDFYLRGSNGKVKKVASYENKASDEVVGIVSANSNSVFVTIRSENDLRLSKIDYKSGKETIIENGINREVAVSPDGNSYIVSKLNTKIKNTSDISSLSDIFYIKGDTKKKIANGFNGISRWDKKSNSFISYGEDSEGRNEVIFTNADLNKKLSLDKSTDGLTINSVLVNNGTDDLLLVDENNKIFHYSKKNYDNVPPLQDDASLHGDFFEEGFNINYFPDDGAYNVYVNSNPFSVNSQKAIEFIKAKNLDPNQLYLRWYADDDVNRGS